MHGQFAEKVPSLVLEAEPLTKLGAVYLGTAAFAFDYCPSVDCVYAGGFRGVMNAQFLRENRVRFVLNCAAGLNMV